MSDHEARVEVRRHEGASRALYTPHPGSGRPLQLNSKKLTGVLLKQLAGGLEVATSASGGRIRIISYSSIKGVDKLCTTQGRFASGDPLSVRAHVCTDSYSFSTA